MSDLDLYREHLGTLDRILTETVERAGQRDSATDGVVLHAGRQEHQRQRSLNTSHRR